jgi:hypothetical protein
MITNTQKTLCIDKLIVSNKKNSEFIITNYFHAGIDTKSIEHSGPKGMSMKMRYINRTENTLISRYDYIFLDDTKKYKTLVIDECPELFVMTGLFYCVTDLRFQLEIAYKYFLNIEQQTFKYIYSLYNNITKLWNPLIECDDFEIIKDDFEIVEVSTKYKVDNYTNINKIKCVDIIEESLLEEIFILLYNKKYYKSMLYLYGFVSFHPKMKHLIFNKNIQLIFNQDNSILDMLFKFSNVAINMLYIDDITVYVQSNKNDKHIIKGIHNMMMMKKYNSKYDDPFIIRVLAHHPKPLLLEQPVIGIDMNLFKKNIITLSNGVLSDNFNWHLFSLTGTCIIKLLTNDISKIQHMDLICNDRNKTFDDMFSIVKTSIIDENGYENKIKSGKFEKKISVYHRNTIPLNFSLCSMGDIAKGYNNQTNVFFDGKQLYGYPRFWYSLFCNSRLKYEVELFEYINTFV